MTASCRLANSAGGMTGSAARGSMKASATNATIATTMQTTGSIGPPNVAACASRRVSAIIAASKPVASVTMPATSSAPRTWAAVVGTSRRARTMTTSASGTLAPKIQCHETKCVTTPPNVGPMMAATPHTAPRMPSAEPRFSGGTRSAIAAVATGNMPPAPIAWIARAARKMPNVGATIASTLPAAKMERHAM